MKESFLFREMVNSLQMKGRKLFVKNVMNDLDFLLKGEKIGQSRFLLEVNKILELLLFEDGKMHKQNFSEF